jgi:hypothetical protein
MRELAILILLAALTGAAVADEVDGFNVPRPDLMCVDMDGQLRVMKRVDDTRIGTIKTEPVVIEKMPADWKAGNWEVVIEGGNCVRRATSRNLDQEDYMLQHDVRDARKAAREAAKADPVKLEAVKELQGDDPGAVDVGITIAEPSTPRENRRDKSSVADKLPKALQDKMEELAAPVGEIKQ